MQGDVRTSRREKDSLGVGRLSQEMGGGQWRLADDEAVEEERAKVLSRRLRVR